MMDRRRKSDVLFGVGLTANAVGVLEMALLHHWLLGTIVALACTAVTCVGWTVNRKVFPRLPAGDQSQP